MSKYCPECRQANEDSRIFCSCCGAALDANVRLVQDLEKVSKINPKETPAPPKKAISMISPAPPSRTRK